MPKKKKTQKLKETHLKQNYVDEADLVPFLTDRFGEDYRILTLEDGSKMVEAPRRLSEAREQTAIALGGMRLTAIQEEVDWLKQLKANREPRQSVFSY